MAMMVQKKRMASSQAGRVGKGLMGLLTRNRVVEFSQDRGSVRSGSHGCKGTSSPASSSNSWQLQEKTI